MKTKFISMVLSFSMCLALCSCNDKPNVPAVVVDYGAEEDEYVYTGNGTSAWCSSLFESPATEYNNELALVAADLSNAAENDNGDNTTIREKFSEYSLYACEYYNFNGTGLLAGGGAFAIGEDTLTINGVNTTILIVVARGTKTLREMIGDVAKGGEVDFPNAKVWDNVSDSEKKILDGIDQYISMYPSIQSAKHLKILVTGHSLGGAAANMFGARLTHGVGSGEWWGDKLSKDDIYVYTFGAIKVLTTEDNITAGYENIHNVYNYYDSYGPNGNQKGTNASSPNAKFGHTEVFSFIKKPETGTTILDSCNNHLMDTYLDALKAFENGGDSIDLACRESAEPPLKAPDVGNADTPEASAPADPPTEYEGMDVFDAARSMGYEVEELSVSALSNYYYYVSFSYNEASFLVSSANEPSGDILFYGKKIEKKDLTMGTFCFTTFYFSDGGNASRDSSGHWTFSTEQKEQLLNLLANFKKSGPSSFMDALTPLSSNYLSQEMSALVRELDLNVAYQKIRDGYRFMVSDGENLAWFAAVYSDADFRPSDNASGLSTYIRNENKYKISGVLGSSFPTDYVNKSGQLISEPERADQLRNFFAGMK